MTKKTTPFISSVTCTAQPGALPVYLQEPGPNDVLLGRGAPFLNFEGNKRFRLIIQSSKGAYQSASRNRDKNNVARSIINEIAKNGGRFLEPVVDTYTKIQMRMPAESRLWRLAADDVAMEKCRQALRNRSTNCTASRDAIRSHSSKPPPSQELTSTVVPYPATSNPSSGPTARQQTPSVSTMSSSGSGSSQERVPNVTSTANSSSAVSSESNNSSFFMASGVPANVSTGRTSGAFPAPPPPVVPPTNAPNEATAQLPQSVADALEEIRQQEEQAQQLQLFGQYLANVGRQKAQESQERRAALAAKILSPQQQQGSAAAPNHTERQPELKALLTLANSLQGSIQDPQQQSALPALLAQIAQAASPPLQQQQQQVDAKPAAVGKRKKFPSGNGGSESSMSSAATATPSSTLSWLGSTSNNNLSDITMTIKSITGDNASSLSIGSPSEYFHTSSSSDNDNAKRTEDSDGNASTIPSGSGNSHNDEEGNESNEDSASNSENEGEERKRSTHSSSDGDVSSG